MGFSNKIQKYFTNLFISIVEKDNSYMLLAKVVKNSKIKEKFSKEFKIQNYDEKVNSEMEKYLVSLQEKYDYVYIALLLNSLGQGAITGTSDEEFKRFSVDPKNVKTVKFKTWSAYVSFIDINWIQKIYAGVGIDLIYSPFVVLYHLLSQYKLKYKPTLYILNQEDSVTISVFKEDTLQFGAFYKINKEDLLGSDVEVEDWESEEEKSPVENFISLENVGDEEESFSDLGDLSEFDMLDNQLENEEFSDIVDENSLDDEKESETDEISMDDIELYGRDLEIYKFLNKALKEYYQNEIYESDFIEQAVIFDAYDMSQEMMQSFEEDLMLDLKVHKIDIGEVVNNLSIKEVYGEL